MKLLKKVISNNKITSSKPVIIPIDYDSASDKEEQLCSISKTELTGFVPRSVEIRRMFAQGELYTIMKEYEIGNMMGRDVQEIPVGLANIKNLDKVDLEKAIKSRVQHYNKLVENAQDSLKKNFQNSQRSDSVASETSTSRAGGNDEN